MKKLVTLLLTAALAITAATTAFADTKIESDKNGEPTPDKGSINVTYTVSPSYTVTIPGNVVLDTTNPSKATVSATNVTVPFGKSVQIALNSNTNFTVKTDEGAALAYKVKKGTADVLNDNVILEVASGSGSTELTFELADKKVTYSGEYKDTVTFKVSVDKATT